MALLFTSRPFSTVSKQGAIEELLDKATPDRDYYLLLIGSVILAIGAIFTDSIPVLIASMIVAPLAYPILTLGLGAAAGSWRLMGRAALLFGFSCGVGLLIAIAATTLFGNDRAPDILISFTSNSYVSGAIAVVSGIIAAYGLMRPKVGSAITGIAIAVSLMPPLVATGIDLTPGSVTLPGAPGLLLLNVMCIFVASSLTFSLLGIGKTYRQTSGQPRTKQAEVTT